MSLLSRVVDFLKGAPVQKPLQVHYLELHLMAEEIRERLSALRSIQESIVKERMGYVAAEAERARGAGTKKIETTGTGVVQRTAFVEKELLQELEGIVQQARVKFDQAERELPEPTDPALQANLAEIKSFLAELDKQLHDIEDAVLNKPQRDLSTVHALADRFRDLDVWAGQELTILIDKLYQPVAPEKARKIIGRMISPLMKNVYQHALEMKVGDEKILAFEVSEEQLRKLHEEALDIIAARDPDTQVLFRREGPVPKADVTGLQIPHVNVSMKLLGGPWKKIHVLVRAA